jgi:hypothetical protein
MIYDNVAITTQTMNIYIDYINNAEINSEVILVLALVCNSNVVVMEEIWNYFQ